MKILVTGGAGFIASHIVDTYVAAGHEVIVIDDLTVGKRENLNPAAKFFHVDVADEKQLKNIFVQEKPEVINHHAAQKFLRRSVEFPAEDANINIIGSINLLHLAAQYGCKQFIFASTAAVYGNSPDHLPYKENYGGWPIAPYGVAKLSVEHYMYTYALNYGLPTLSLRYSNVYGPRQDAHGESGIIAILTEKLLANESPVVFGTGEQSRDFVYVGDVAAANLKALNHPGTDIVNICTMTETSINTVYRQIQQVLDVQIEPTKGEAKRGDPLRLVLDNKKAATVLGWQPTTSFEQGLKVTVESFKK